MQAQFAYVLAELAKPHRLMIDYSEFTTDEDGIFVSHLCPSRPLIIAGEIIPGEHPHAESGCCQFWWRKDHSSWPALIACYMRMVRCGRPDYLDRWWLSNEDPVDRKHVIWQCDGCQAEPDASQVPAWNCPTCEDFDFCPTCHDTQPTCPVCETLFVRDNTWLLT